MSKPADRSITASATTAIAVPVVTLEPPDASSRITNITPTADNRHVSHHCSRPPDLGI